MRVATLIPQFLRNVIKVLLQISVYVEPMIVINPNVLNHKT